MRLPLPDILPRIPEIGGALQEGEHDVVKDASRDAHRPEDVEEKYYPLLVGVVLDLMLVGVVEHDALALIPVENLVIHPYPALVALLRDDESEMDAHNAIGRPFVGWDTVAGFEDGEPGVLQFRTLFQQFRGLGTALTVAVDPVAQGIKYEGFPVVAPGDAFLVR